jgi:hydroxysqualene dehydroxylase
MRQARVHIIGAGLAGLAASVSLAKAGFEVILSESAPHAGGRCRSYFEPALGMEIDNGNHLVLSGNRLTMDYVGAIGASDQLVGPEVAEFDFIDLTAGDRWRLRPNRGRIPWWIFDVGRRVPATGAADYLSLAPILLAGKGAAIGDAIRCSGRLYDRLWRPLLLAALNTEPAKGSASLAAAVIRQSLARGGSACRPLTARDGLSRALVDPAVAFLEKRGATVRFGRRLRSLDFAEDRVAALDFGAGPELLGEHDHIVLSVPAHVASALVPGIVVPLETQAIVNGHFKIDPPPGFPRMLGVVGGAAEWIFSYPNRLSTTTSGANRLLDTPREELAAELWTNIRDATGITADLPPWQIVKERRATFAATPAENARRPHARTKWRNLMLAGDFTNTGLPATIEGAVGSGFRAADLVRQGAGVSRSRAA